VIGQSLLHSPAKIVVERQSQLTGSSLSALEPRQIERKLYRRTVLLAAAYSAKDLRTALNRHTHPSNMPLMATHRAPSEVTRSAGLPACNRLRPPAHLSQFSHRQRFVFGPQDAQQKLQRIQSAICHSRVGRYQPFSSQISPDQGARLLPKPNCAWEADQKAANT
jgi:hypothetical protein